jgi:hypothetical protein
LEFRKEKRPMGVSEGGMRLIQVEGKDTLLVERLRGPLSRALGGRRTFYSVRIEAVGRVGEVLVRIEGAKGHLALLFRGEEELEAGYISRAVSDTVSRFGI